MSQHLPEIFRATAAIGRASRSGVASELDDARRDLAAAKIAHAIDKCLSVAPPLSDSQVERLSSLLRGA